MSTITVERPEETAKLPEWRRLCHYYFPDSDRSACGYRLRGHLALRRGRTLQVQCVSESPSALSSLASDN